MSYSINGIINLMGKMIRDGIFFVLVLLIIFFGLFTFMKAPKEISKSENRTLEKIPFFTFREFLDGEYQSKLESAISDQVLFSEQIRTNYNIFISKLPSFGIEQRICVNHYLELINSKDRRRATFNCDDYIVYYPENLTDEREQEVLANISRYNKVNERIDTYYYFINDSSAYDFENNNYSIDYGKILKDNLIGNYNLDTFSFDNYDEYKERFYKTDHHWNYLGSYSGYLDIVNLLNDKAKIIKPTKLKTNNEIFFGSHAQNTKNYSIEEVFSYYDYNIPNFSTYINGVKATYGHKDDYELHNYNYEKETNYYEFLYGGDEGEIIYDFDQPTKKNLLVISNSYSNPINSLIAANYNKTFVVDLRHFNRKMDKKFILSEYINRNQIDKVLFIMSAASLYMSNLSEGIEL